VTNLNSFFRNNATFNQDISGWNVSHVTEFYSMFSGAAAFNQSINNWDVSSALSMGNMFDDMATFNQPLNNWNVSQVTNMGCMFCFSTSFNQDLSAWDVSNVTDMNNLFWGATAFNQDISGWDVSSVVEMSYIFEDATSFDQDLSSWNVSNVTDMYNVFRNSALSVGNYSNILSGWSQRTLQSGVEMTLIGPNGSLTPYCDTAQSARDILTGTYGWTITDGGSVPCFTLSYTAGTNALIVGSGSQTVVSGANGTSVEVVPDPGYRFVGWSDSRTDNPRIDNGVTANITVSATIDVAPDGGSSGSSATRVGDRMERLENLEAGVILASTSPTTVTFSSFVASIRDFINYLTVHEDELETLTPEERTRIIIVLRDIILYVLRYLPGV
jgi:surface protein